MAKVAFAFWNGRIAPVFDVARSIQLVEIEDGEIVNQRPVGVTGDLENLKAACLAELGVGTLVCGAISRPLQAMISAYGIEVIAFVAGNLQEIIQAWVCGLLADSDAYAMPGCRRARGRRLQDRDDANLKESRMDGSKGRKKGAGQSAGAGSQRRKGQGQGSRRQASGAGPDTVATGEICVCPQCGRQQPHARGVPCARHKCPQCGTTMIRQQTRQ